MRIQSGMLTRIAIASLLTFACAPALAADLTVRVTDQGGAPLAGVVVQLIPEGARRATGAPATHVVDQDDEVFLPLVTLVQPSDSVRFRNIDSMLHHV